MRRCRSLKCAILLTVLLLPGGLHAQTLQVDPPVLDFGRVQYGGDRCLTATLTNTGQTPVALIAVRHAAEPFPADVTDSLQPGASTVQEVCFAGRTLGPDTSIVHFIFDAGNGPDTLLVPAYASGWDSLAVGIGVTVSGMPGSVIRLPMRVFGRIPAAHDIRRFTVEMQYNKTLLYPLSNVSMNGGTLAGGMDNVRVDVLRDYSQRPARVRFLVEGDTPLINPRSDSVLFSPPFLVLQGNAMSCDLTLSSVRFAQGLPRGGAFLKCRFEADSICYQRLRLVDYPSIGTEPEIGSFPNPAAAATAISCFLPVECGVRISVHDILGGEVLLVHEGELKAGDHVFPVSLEQLARGRYLCRVTTAYGKQQSTMLIRQ